MKTVAPQHPPAPDGQEGTRLGPEFLGGLGHALRTPLNGIIGFTELLLSGRLGTPAPGHEEILESILTSAREMFRVMEDVASLARLDAGRVRFEPRSLELERLVAEVKEVFQEQFSRKSARMELEVEPRVRHASLDPGSFRQLLASYLGSALELMPEGGLLTVRLALLEGDTRLRLEVAYRGQSVSPELLPGLFAPFEHVAGQRDPRFRGTGLRLALARHLVEAQGGSVGARDEPGQGGVLQAVLPLGSAGMHPPEREEEVDGAR